MLGHNANLGHADFYPNSNFKYSTLIFASHKILLPCKHVGGKAAQPGCNFQNDFIGACSHGRSYRYFAESIHVKNGFMSLECATWEDYRAKRCSGDPIPMGEATPNNANGTYFLETGSGPSYAKYQKILF